MRLDFSNAQQTETFLLSLLIGVSFCVFYDVLRFLLPSKAKLPVFFRDVAFFLVCGVASFCFLLLYCKGVLRVYVFCGEALGFIFCRVTFSKLFRRILNAIAAVFKKLFSLALKPVRKAVKLVLLVLLRLLNRIKRLCFKLYLKRENKAKSRKNRSFHPKNDKKEKKFKKFRKNNKKTLETDCADVV